MSVVPHSPLESATALSADRKSASEERGGEELGSSASGGDDAGAEGDPRNMRELALNIPMFPLGLWPSAREYIVHPTFRLKHAPPYAEDEDTLHVVLREYYLFLRPVLEERVGHGDIMPERAAYRTGLVEFCRIFNHLGDGPRVKFKAEQLCTWVNWCHSWAHPPRHLLSQYYTHHLRSSIGKHAEVTSRRMMDMASALCLSIPATGLYGGPPDTKLPADSIDWLHTEWEDKLCSIVWSEILGDRFEEIIGPTVAHRLQ